MVDEPSDYELAQYLLRQPCVMFCEARSLRDVLALLVDVRTGLAEACDVPVRWSCRTGVCHTCETTLIAGDVEYSPDPVEPPADGSALICCSQPRDDVVLDL